MVFADRCVDGILATGDGSESRPFLVARMSDEADLLDAKFKTQIDSQGLIFRDDKRYDKILGKDGNTYWFDVSMPLDRVPAGAAQSPVAAAAGGRIGAQASPCGDAAQTPGWKPVHGPPAAG